MDNIICHTVNCEHNVKSRCVAGIVNITEKGVCASKIKREGGILALLPISRRRKTSAQAISKTPSRARPLNVPITRTAYAPPTTSSSRTVFQRQDALPET